MKKGNVSNIEKYLSHYKKISLSTDAPESAAQPVRFLITLTFNPLDILLTQAGVLPVFGTRYEHDLSG